MSQVAASDDLLSVGQVSEELGKPSRTVHHWIQTGRIAAVKVGSGRTNAYAITRAEVDRLKAEAA
jgi:excisionase family DNA binding protein